MTLERCKNCEGGTRCVLLETFFDSGKDISRLDEIIEFGVGPHINISDLSINESKWSIDEEIRDKWNSITPEVRRRLVRSMRRRRFSAWESLQEAIESEDPLSVLFTDSEIDALYIAFHSGGRCHVDCRGIIVGNDLRPRLQEKWNSLPTDLRMGMLRSIRTPKMAPWKPRT